MKENLKAKVFLRSFILAATVMLTVSAVLAVVLLKTGMANAAGAAGAITAVAASFAGSLYAGKKGAPYCALIFGGMLFCVMLLVSLVTPSYDSMSPFVVPLCCAGGILLAFLLSAGNGSGRSKGKKTVKKLLKRR